MKTIWLTILILCAVPAAASAQTHAPLLRQYVAGQALAYRMTADNDGWRYTVEAHGTVVKDASGAFYEDYSWTHLVSDGKAQALPAAHQQLSLDLNRMPAPPDLSQVDQRLIGPVTDMLTFYADLWLAGKFNQLNKPGDHFYFPNPITPSWADGAHVTLGEDAIDFDMTLKAVDAAAGTATLDVRHVSPAQPKVHLPAPWMQTPVTTGANNWVEVRKLDNGAFQASVGQETFDVELTVSLSDGRILRAAMTNPVKTVVRTCSDEALTHCDAAKPHEILRKVSIEPLP